jgi:hypothetical protein
VPIPAPRASTPAGGSRKSPGGDARRPDGAGGHRLLLRECLVQDVLAVRPLLTRVCAQLRGGQDEVQDLVSCAAVGGGGGSRDTMNASTSSSTSASSFRSSIARASSTGRSSSRSKTSATFPPALALRGTFKRPGQREIGHMPVAVSGEGVSADFARTPDTNCNNVYYKQTHLNCGRVRP